MLLMFVYVSAVRSSSDYLWASFETNDEKLVSFRVFILRRLRDTKFRGGL